METGVPTFELHSDFETLLKTAVGTAFALRLVDVAGPIGDTLVDLLVLDGSLEESLARLAGEQSVVVARDLVSADGAQFFDAFLGVGQVVAVARAGGAGARRRRSGRRGAGAAH